MTTDGDKNPLTFEQVKNQVAKLPEYGYIDWKDMATELYFGNNFKEYSERLNKAAELYAESRAKDAWERACEAMIDEVKSTISDEYRYEFVKPPYKKVI